MRQQQQPQQQQQHSHHNHSQALELCLEAQNAEAAGGGGPSSHDMAYLTSQALMLTFQEPIELDEFNALDFWENVKEYSWCLEDAAGKHTHVFLVIMQKPNYVDAEVFDIRVLKPHITPSSVRGRSARRGQDRGHFYVFNPYTSTQCSELGELHAFAGLRGTWSLDYDIVETVKAG